MILNYLFYLYNNVEEKEKTVLKYLKIFNKHLNKKKKKKKQKKKFKIQKQLVNLINQYNVDLFCF